MGECLSFVFVTLCDTDLQRLSLRCVPTVRLFTTTPTSMHGRIKPELILNLRQRSTLPRPSARGSERFPAGLRPVRRDAPALLMNRSGVSACLRLHPSHFRSGEIETRARRRTDATASFYSSDAERDSRAERRAPQCSF